MSTPQRKLDLETLERQIDSSFQKLQQLRAYMRGYEAAGGKLDFQIDGLDDALDIAAATLLDYKVKMIRERAASEKSATGTKDSDPF